MIFDDFSKIDEDLFDTILDEDFQFEGVLKNSTSLIIKGRITGKIESENLLILGPNALIQGDIYTKNLQCFGKVDGNIYVEEEAYFYIKSEVNGNITTNLITVEKGSIINGFIKMNKKSSSTDDPKMNREPNRKENFPEDFYSDKNGSVKSRPIDGSGVNNSLKVGEKESL